MKKLIATSVIFVALLIAGVWAGCSGKPVSGPQPQEDINLTPEEMTDKGIEYEKEENYTEAVKWYRKAADQGYAIAQCLLGTCYYNGEGVPQSYEEAVKWYRKSAEQDFSVAQLALGQSYANGEGVPQSDEEAFKWMLKAADQGNVAAQFNIGFCYETGSGVPKNYEEAVKWYRKAAAQGNENAKEKLEKMR